MSKVSGRAAWILWALAVALTAWFVVVLVLSWGGPGPLEYERDAWFVGILVLLFLSFPTIGAIVAARRPENAIGWLFLGAGVAMSGGFSAQAYAELALIQEPGLAGGQAALWVSSWLPTIGLFVLPIYLLFLFPTGRPASRWWGILLSALTVLVLTGLAATALKPGPIDPFPGLDNPLGASASFSGTLQITEAVFEISGVPCFLLAAISLIHRLRRAGGEERLQIRWFVFTASLAAVGFAVAFAAPAIQWLADLGFVLGASTLVALPVVSGIAILKYRLYEIDRIINRTLVYGTLTAILLAGYAGGVLVFRSLLPLADDSSVAVAASTLAMAALFRPLRRRVQDLVDRSFYRSRYDAAHLVESFGARLRSQTELEGVTSDLLAVVDRAVHPAHMAVWMPASENTGVASSTESPRGAER